MFNAFVVTGGKMIIRISGNEWLMICDQFTEREKDEIALATTFDEELISGNVNEGQLHPYLVHKLRLAKMELN